MSAKEVDWRAMSDAECVQWDVADAMCKTHHQALVSCANGRMAQVKEARAMAETRGTWARVWQKIANDHYNSSIFGSD